MPTATRAADDGGGTEFLGHSVKGPGGVYAVTKDVNVRAAPRTGAKRVGKLRQEERVEVVGQAKGSWMAVRPKEGKPGFVYAPVLVPVIDGKVIGPISGKAEPRAGTACEFVIRFDGYTPVEGQPFRSADYRALLHCLRNGKPLVVELPMFVTEGPYNGGLKPIHQIGIDVLELSKEYDQFFSTYLLYDRTKAEVRFDTINLKDYWIRKKVAPIAVDSLGTALAAALKLAVQTWNARVWTDLAKALEERAKG